MVGIKANLSGEDDIGNVKLASFLIVVDFRIFRPRSNVSINPTQHVHITRNQIRKALLLHIIDILQHLRFQCILPE